jgi:hypothetical protein
MLRASAALYHESRRIRGRVRGGSISASDAEASLDTLSLPLVKLPYLKRQLDETSRERRQLEQTAAELAGRVGEFDRRASDFLRVASELVRGPEGLDSLPFEERRLLLSVLRIAVRASGDDPARFAFQIKLPDH